MNLEKDQEIFLSILEKCDSEDEEEVPQDVISCHSSDSETEDNLENDFIIDTDQSEKGSDDQDLIASRKNRKRRRIIDSDDEITPPEQPRRSQGLNQDVILQLDKDYIYGKNKHKWATKPRSSRCRTSSRNIVHFIPGPVGEARNLVDPLALFHLFFSKDMVNEIVLHTNVEIDLKKKKYKKDSYTTSHTSPNEIKALLGLLIQAAAMKSNHLPTRVLFDPTKSGTVFKACMSAERFDFLLRCCRFDDKSTRQERKASDRFAPIRKIWEDFIANCKKWYKPSSYVTIDEQLVGFRGRCPFRMYIPNKPNKYGIKIVMVADSNSRYAYNATPYLGKSTDTGNLPLGTYFVKHLCEPLYGSNRNITMDNWFTSVPLASELLRSPYKLTIVGTVRSNKKEIPSEMKNSKDRHVGTSMFGFDGEKTLVSFKPKSNKMVYLLSTAHDQPNINGTTSKPEIIHFYNSTKGAVDTIDQMCSGISANRKTNRWPQAIFYNILNLTMVNIYVIYVSNMVRLGQKPLKRRALIQRIADGLTEPWLHERYGTPTLRRDIKATIKDILKIYEAASSSTQEQTNKRKICAFCPYKKRRMTKYSCYVCKKAICGEHTVPTCNDCKE